MKLGISEEFPISLGFDNIEQVLKELMLEEKFGALTEIDVKATMKKKLDKDLKPYKIYGFCNPPHALKVLSADPEVGLLLPCNAIVYETENETIKVSLVNAKEMFTIIDLPEAEEVAEKVTEAFNSVMSKLKTKLQ
ncbi:MAG: DUF302 domain-containing protein [Candidatus Heimdallarchaeota archaeon]|nr:DUF302 domain-containing protein [Candidatus Heimdallarchaeota archaeon]